MNMQASLTIIRYPKIFIPFAFFAMAIHRLSLWHHKHIRFYKLMGCGRNGTFDLRPDLQQWALLTVHDHAVVNDKQLLKNLYGRFISSWFHFFNCEAFTILLVPVAGHGLWDNQKVFGELPGNHRHVVTDNGPMAVLTRASIRLNKLKYFWQHVAAVTRKMHESKGFITSVGMGEVPWVKLATFSIWETARDMTAFAYGMQEHVDVIKQTREQKWYTEEMFIRFRIMGHRGTLNGKNPLGMYDV